MHSFFNAPLHMNVMVVFFTILPIILWKSISFAKNRKYKLHFISQGFILILTILVLSYFEIMIRVDSGFFEFIKKSSISHDFLTKYLLFHIIISSVSAILWITLFFKSMNMYRAGKMEELKSSKHKRIGITTFVFLLLSCITGVFVYLFLFIF